MKISTEDGLTLKKISKSYQMSYNTFRADGKVSGSNLDSDWAIATGIPSREWQKNLSKRDVIRRFKSYLRECLEFKFSPGL